MSLEEWVERTADGAPFGVGFLRCIPSQELNLYTDEYLGGG
jgi:hypothetical protein